jgi:hypothetical protein
MGPVIADVSVRADSDAGMVLRFFFPPTGEVINLPLSYQRLEALQSMAGERLGDVVGRAVRLNATTAQAAGALKELHRAGGDLAELLAPERRFLRLQEAFRAAWPLWDQTDWGFPDAPLPIVQINCREDALPLELLPVFDLGTLTEPRTHDDRVRAASRFLGFTAVVRRTVAASTAADRLIRNDPALPVQFLRNWRLRSAMREAEFLAGLAGHVRVEGPWPVSGTREQVQDLLLRALYAGDPLDGGTAGDPPVQIHHFACHCDTTKKRDDHYTLRLSTKRGWRRSISLGQLRQAYRERLAADPDPHRHRAIVMLNACGSSHTDPRTAASFARWFVGSGHRAFIGTETVVPDRVASAFAAAFYGRLLEARRPLGEAIVWARRDLLRDFRNPLGLLYVVYGDTDLTVERARPGIYRAMP